MSSTPPEGSQYTAHQLLRALAWKAQAQSLNIGDNADTTAGGDRDGMPSTCEEYTRLIQELHLWIASLDRRDNAVQDPITRLPPEITTLIFEMVQEPEKHAKSGVHDICSTQLRIRPWFQSLTAVCHSWRQFVVSKSKFWRIVPLHAISRGGAKLGELFLARSWPDKVKIWLPSYLHSPNDWRDFITRLQQELDRLEVLDSGSAIESYPELVSSLLQTPRENLRWLSLKGEKQSELPLPSGLSLQISSLFLQHTHLGRLELHSYSLPTINTRLDHLTHLQLSHGARFTVQMCLTMLRLTPRLEVLLLKYKLLDPTPNIPLVPVSLPSLQILVVTQDITAENAASSLITSLQMPQNVDIRFREDSYLSLLETVRYLACGHPVIYDPGQDYRLQSDLAFLPWNAVKLFYNNTDRLINFHTIIIYKIPSDWFKWPSFFRSPTTEHCHVDWQNVDNNTLGLLERQARPLFPNLVKMTLWNCEANERDKPLDIFNNNSEWRLELLKQGRVTRTKSNGATYVLEYRVLGPEHGPRDLFTFEGVSYIQENRP